MNLSRLRQLGPQQFTKKTEEGWQDKPFLIICVHHDIISSTSTFSHVVVYQLLTFFLLDSTVVSKQQSENPCF